MVPSVLVWRCLPTCFDRRSIPTVRGQGREYEYENLLYSGLGSSIEVSEVRQRRRLVTQPNGITTTRIQQGRATHYTHDRSPPKPMHNFPLVSYHDTAQCATSDAAKPFHSDISRHPYKTRDIRYRHKLGGRYHTSALSDDTSTGVWNGVSLHF